MCGPKRIHMQIERWSAWTMIHFIYFNHHYPSDQFLLRCAPWDSFSSTFYIQTACNSAVYSFFEIKLVEKTSKNHRYENFIQYFIFFSAKRTWRHSVSLTLLFLLKDWIHLRDPFSQVFTLRLHTNIFEYASVGLFRASIHHRGNEWEFWYFLQVFFQVGRKNGVLWIISLNTYHPTFIYNLQFFIAWINPNDSSGHKKAHIRGQWKKNGIYFKRKKCSKFLMSPSDLHIHSTMLAEKKKKTKWWHTKFTMWYRIISKYVSLNYSLRKKNNTIKRQEKKDGRHILNICNKYS